MSSALGVANVRDNRLLLRVALIHSPLEGGGKSLSSSNHRVVSLYSRHNFCFFVIAFSAYVFLSDSTE